MTARSRPRPRRGAPEHTRARLVAAAARMFNARGYNGVDSKAIARDAGYSPGTFYKHFVDKRAIFLAVYESWVQAEWRALEVAVAAAGSRWLRTPRPSSRSRCSFIAAGAASAPAFAR